MPRRRRNDPAGLSDSPHVVTDPAREAELVAEFRRKVEYLKMAYRVQIQLELDRTHYNKSLEKLKLAVNRKRPGCEHRARLHPWLELDINQQARDLANLTSEMALKPEHGPYVEQAAINVASTRKLFRGRPGQCVMRQYVEGFMAAVQEATGKPMIAVRDDKDGVYEPRVPGLMGQALILFVDSLEPGIEVSKLSYWVRNARRRYAGKPMRFRDMFPGYGMTSDAMTGAPVLQPPYQIERTGIIAPIYCP